MTTAPKATWSILEKPVGPKLRNSKNDVRALQELLIAAGYDAGGADGTWRDRTSTALWAFREAHNPGPWETRVDPDSEELMTLVRLAKIEIPMPNEKGMNGIRRMHEWFVSQGTKYIPGAEKGEGNRAIYGIQGRTDYAIQRIAKAWRKGPVEMACSSYANLMLGIFKLGNVHQAPYDFNTNFRGQTRLHLAKDRYKFTEVTLRVGKGSRKYVKSADEMAAVAESEKLYALEAAEASGKVYHLALLYNGEVWECTTNQPASACIRRPIVEFMRNKKGKIVYLFREP